MKARIVSMLRYVALGLVVIASLVAISMHTSSKDPSPECVKVRHEVDANLHMGDNEREIGPFFEKQGWEYTSGSALGLYSAEIPIRRTKVGEEHIVRVTVKVQNGIITHIEVSDLHRFL